MTGTKPPRNKLVAAVGVVLVAVVTLTGATCVKRMRLGYDLGACNGPAFSYVEAMVPTWEYAELRDTSGQTEVLGQAGTRCATASDKAKCEQLVADARTEHGFSNGSHGRRAGHRYVVATRGDTVAIVDGRALGFGEALRPIDSPVKAAAVVAAASNLTPDCQRSVRKTEAGFEVHVATDSCFGPRDEVYLVTPDGRLETLEAWHGERTCVGALPAPGEVVVRR